MGASNFNTDVVCLAELSVVAHNAFCYNPYDFHVRPCIPPTYSFLLCRHYRYHSRAAMYSPSETLDLWALAAATIGVSYIILVNTHLSNSTYALTGFVQFCLVNFQE